jgi:hypothetical protein
VAGELDGCPAVFCFGRDVTERVRRETRALQADRLSALGLLAGGMAHAINNPLTYVLLNLDHVRRSSAASARSLRWSRRWWSGWRRPRAVRSAWRGRPPHARAFAHRRGGSGPVDVAEILRTAIGVVGNEVRHRGTLLADLGEVPLVMGSAPRLEQVFLRPARAGRSGLARERRQRGDPRVLRQQRDQVSSSSPDAGPPFEPDLVARVMDPGLGPAPGEAWGGPASRSARRSCARLGAHSASSRTARGTTSFASSSRVGGPAWNLASQPRPIRLRAADLARVPAPGAGDRRRSGVVSALRLMLEGEHEVTTVASGREALRLLLSEPPFDVVFCDLMMPESPGWTCSRRCGSTAPASSGVSCS